MNGLNDKPTIWFFGCSMTYGAGCKPGDLYHSKYYKDGDKIWTQIVSETLGYNEKNMGVPGSGNIEILRLILENKDNIKPNDIIIVGVTDGSRIQSFVIENSAIVPTSVNHWMMETYPWKDKGLDKEYVDSLNQYMINCRLRYINDHINYDCNLIKNIIELIKPSNYLTWGPELWHNFELICQHTNNEIYDFHWSFNGHRQMSDWILEKLSSNTK